MSAEDLIVRLKRARRAALEGYESLDGIGAERVTTNIGEAHRCFQRAMAWLTAEIASKASE